MKKFIAFLLTFMLAFVIVGCTPSTTDPVLPTGVTVSSPQGNSLGVGDTLTLTATVSPADAENKSVTWSSSNTSIATVSNGVVTGVSAGTVTITATSVAVSSLRGTYNLTVLPGSAVDVNPTAIAFANTSESLATGATLTLSLTYTPANTTVRGVVWSSSNEAVATVSNGVVTALTVGTTIITATSTANSAVRANVTVTVTEAGAEVLVTEITVNARATEFYTNYTQRLTVDVLPENATNKNVTWAVDNTEIATIDENGNLVPVTDGTVKVTATAADGSEVVGEITLTILPMVAPETYAVTTLVGADGIRAGYSTQLQIAVTPENADPTSTYVSSNESLATVDANGLVTCIAPGTVTITCTNVKDPTKTATVTILINDGTERTEPESISISGETQMYIGSSYSIRLSATVLPVTASQNIVWVCGTPNICSVDQEGRVTGIAEGTGRIRATTPDGAVVSGWFNIRIITYVEYDPVDLGGYEIIIMNAESALGDNDPFLETYTQADKSSKQKAWRQVETDFNCKITVVKYPDEAPWGNTRINWIITNATNGTSQCDLGIISSNWIHQFVEGKAAVNVADYYAKYGASQMEPALREVGTYKNGLYIASTGISQTAINIDFGLYYNLAWVERLGVSDPATMFNEGRWTYTGFSEWTRTVQAALGAGEYALGGHPYYWWFGLSNAAGQKIADTTTVQVNISTSKSKEASAMFYALREANCVDTELTWAETDGGFIAGTTVMTTGFFWFIDNANRWKEGQWGADSRYGYVPFPYPDNMDKSQTRISVSGLSVYLYVAGRSYPAGVTTEGVYQAINTMFLETIEDMEADPTFNPELLKQNALAIRLDNAASITAAMFFDSSKVFFDPAHGIYGSTSETPLTTPARAVLLDGADYDESFNAQFSTFDQRFKSIYAAS